MAIDSISFVSLYVTCIIAYLSTSGCFLCVVDD